MPPITKATIISTELKTIGSVVGGIAAILTGVWAIDGHYASAEEVQRIQRGMEQQVRVLRQERIEDEVFKLDIKKQAQGGKLDPMDAALYERYVRRLQAAQQEQKQVEVMDAAKEKK